MAVAISNTANPTSAGTGTTITYSGQSIGTAAHDRIVVLAVGVEAVSGAISSATINFGGGALAMTASTNGIIGNIGARIFWRQAPVGTTADFAITFGGSISTASTQHIAVYSVTGAQGTAATSSSTSDTDADPISSGAITIPTSGGHISVYAGAANGTTRTWTGVTKGLETATGAFDFDTGTSTTAGTPTITVSGANNEDASLAWVNFAANASVERLPAQTNLAVSFTTPAVTHFDNGWTISPAAKDLAFSPSQPAVGMEKDLNAVDLLLSGSSPTSSITLGTSISVPTVDLALSRFSPTVDVVVAGIGISPAQANLTISTTAPYPGYERFPGADDLALSSTSPTLLEGVFHNPPQANLVLSPTLETVFHAKTRDIPQTNLTLSPTAPSAVVLPQFAHDISPATKDLVLSPTQPAVGIVKVLDADDLLLSTTVATVSIATSGATTINPPTVNLTLSSTAPDAGFTSDIPADQLIISTTAPTFDRVAGLVPARVDLVLSTSVPTPTISAANNTTITPDTRNLIISGSQPAVGVVKVLNHRDMFIDGSVPPSVVVDTNPGVSRSPPADDLVLSTTAPSVTIPVGSVTRNPAAVDLTITRTAPDPGRGSDLPKGNLIISTTAPTIVQGGVLVPIFPARVDLIISTIAASVILAVPRDPPRVDLAISRTAPDVTITALGVKTPARIDLVLSTTAPTLTIPSATGGSSRGQPFIASMGAMTVR